MQNYPDISAEKFTFVQKTDLSHDKKLDTKPVGYFTGAFRRFCKNKGAIVGAIIIIILVLFAIIAPFCTPYTPSYRDPAFEKALPKNKLFVNTSFWDGCKETESGWNSLVKEYAKGLETGHNAIKNQAYSYNEKTGNYKYRLDSYYSQGFGAYKIISPEEFQDIQRYQNETGRQVIYPTVRLSDRPAVATDALSADYYYETTSSRGMTIPVLKDKNDPSSVIPVYWTYKVSDPYDDGYDSLRIEGENGFTDSDGDTCYYAYSRLVTGGQKEVRLNYYEYYIYNHTQVLKDGITEPYFIFGCDTNGKDIFSCLASGARFSFLFAIAVAVVNMIVGALYGAVEGYYGGKVDIIMERISDILNAVPFMIVITLLKLHMGGSSHVLVLFIAFFLTGWIGMASTTRMQFYRYKNQEYVLAARTLGARDGRLMFKHIFPNAIGTLVTSCALIIPSMIYSEVNLSYLSIINLSSGNITSVGTIIANGQGVMDTMPHIAMFPTVFLTLLMLCFNLFGNGLRDAFNPSLRGSEG